MSLRDPRIGVVVALLAVPSGCVTRAETIVFRNGDVNLAGTLHLPSGEPPHPAILLVHGDGPETRSGYEFAARRFAAAGIAALVYDKRGAGQSTGRWPARFADLAADAAAGLQYLRGRAEVDGSCVGVWGGSQGGWIAPVAAGTSRARYVIVKAGTPVGPAELTRWKTMNRVRAAGYGPEAVDRISRLMDVQFRILRGEEAWDQLAADVRGAAGEPWFPLVPIIRHPGWRSSWMQYGADIDFDPLPVLARLDVPMLWLLGESDPETPLDLTLARLEELKRGGKDLTTHVFRGADHQLELPRRAPARPNFAPGYPDLMVKWAADRCP